MENKKIAIVRVRGSNKIKGDIEDTMKNHILAEASLMGVYEKIRK